MKTSNKTAEPSSSDDPIPSTTHHLGPPRIRRSALPSSFFLPTVEGYDQLHLVGEGGMGSVYRARDTRLKRLVALKMLKSGTLHPDRLARFRTEAEALARLTHPHIVPLFAWNEQGPFLVLEYVSGGTLDDKLKEGPLEFAEAARLITVLAHAVQAAHDAGVVHRDLKPGNVLLAPPVKGNSGTVCGGFPKVSDFGLAQLVDSGKDVTASGMVLGTPAYMAPEQATGNIEVIGPPCDVWALGVLMYRTLTGRLPFQATDPDDLFRWIINHPPRPLNDVRRDVPKQLQAICLSCLKKNPQSRPTAAGLAARLERYLRQQETTLSSPPPAQPRRRLSRVALGGLLAVALGGIVGLVASRLPRRPLPSPLQKITSLRVIPAAGGGVIGETRSDARVGDKVRVEAELAEPGFAYLIALGCDGKDQLLISTDKATSIRYPAGTGWYTLDQEARGGMQGFVVIANHRPLPPYGDWLRRHGQVQWRHMPPSRHAFGVENNLARIVGPGAGGPGPPGPLLGSLERMARSLSGAPDEAFRALVFPVNPEVEKW